MSPSIIFWIFVTIVLGGALGGAYLMLKIHRLSTVPVSKEAEEKYKNL